MFENIPNLNNVALAAITALTISLLSTPFVIFLSEKFGLIDDPAKNKHPKVIHTYPVPRAGGLAIYLGVLFSSLLFLPLDKHLLAILLGATIITILGLLDDKYNINPYIRMVVLLVISVIPVVSGIGISYLTNPLGGTIDLSKYQISFNLFGNSHNIWIIEDVFAICWIFFLMNIINMGAKGVDGQLPGVSTIAAMFIAVLSFRYSADITQWPVIVLASITAGAFLGFLPWNFYPQKIMPGYSGSTLAGYLLSVLSILSTTKVGTLFVLLSIPIIDTLYTITRRVISGKSPVWGDKGHLHHRLLESGLSKRMVAIFYWLGAFVLGLFAISLNAQFKLYTILIVAVFVGFLLLTLKESK
ncbi:MAG: undecaprenyl/decaprenyl-phosphate alpha-N-acetylglucosaminyl 1-phosphate transferase [Patescibacteria group bacterium]|nr:undecaprenyl/decaprenyl-phosphate alpha-N-acetylglucosaminyl 1-phosphate transferase [Patescibacteria group bacterium]